MLATLSNPILTQSFMITRTRRETRDTFTLELHCPGPEGMAPVEFLPGQFNMLYSFGQGEVPISISGDPAQPWQLVHTIRAVGSVTLALGHLKPGDAIGVRGPYGSSWPVEACRGKNVLLIAGGIGLAPLRPAIYQLLADRAAYGQVVLLYGARTQEDILYKQDLKRWGGRFDLEQFVIVDRSTGNWRGNVGVVTALIHRAPIDPSNSIALICGPEIMMRFSIHELLKRGLSKEQIYVSLERNMKCAVGFCGHCQAGPEFICKDGPVFRYDRVERLMHQSEV